MIMTQSQLVARLEGERGTLIVGIEALTDTRARKTGNPFGQIFKRVRCSGVVGADYQRAVEREAGRQGADASEFDAEPLPWGEWLIPGKVITHKGGYYLRTQYTPGQRKLHTAKVLGYFDSAGARLDLDKIKAFLPASRESAKQQDEAGLGETVQVRTYKLDSIQRIRLDGKTFKLVA